MSGSLNKVMLIGNLGRDPEIRDLPSGGRVANLRVATTESWKGRDNQERQEKTEWHTISCFSDGLVTVIERYLKKGHKVFIEGSLQTRKWTDKEGKERYSTEIVIRGFQGQLVMLGSAGGGSGAGFGGDERQQVSKSDDSAGGSNMSKEDTASDFNDEIPF